MSESKTIRIVPRQNIGNGPTPTKGTEVWCGDQKLKVMKITLTASAQEGFWHAVIETLVQVEGDIHAEGEVKDDHA